MSWYDRAKSFVAHTSATAADVEAEFDNIATAFNGLFQGARVPASAKVTFGASYSDVTGTEDTITLDQDSLVKVDVVFDVSVTEGSTFQGGLVVDGSGQTPEAVHVGTIGGSSNSRTVVGQTYMLELAAGAHVLKLRGKRNGAAEIFNAANTGYTYLVVPNPDP